MPRSRQRAASACLVAASLIGHAAASVLRWERLAPADGVSPAPRRDLALGHDAESGRAFLFGGRTTAGRVLDDTHVFDTSARQWQEATGTPRPAARFSMVSGLIPTSSAESGGAFVIAMGEGSNRRFFNDVWALNLTSLAWAQLRVHGTAPAPRYGASGGIGGPQGRWFVVSHGFATQRYDDTFAFDTRSLSWQQIGPAQQRAARPFARCLHSGAVLPASTGEAAAFVETVMFGGCGSGGHGPCPADDAWVLRAAVGAGGGALPGLWTPLPSCLGPALWSCMAPAPGADRTVLVLGGSGGVWGDPPAGSVALLGVDDGAWRLVQPEGPTAPSAREGAACSGHGGPNGTVLAFGGSSGGDELWLLRGSDAAGLPSRSCASPWDLRSLHAVLMLLSWGILLPVGVTIARFGRGWGPRWFAWHRALQTAGTVLQLAGAVVAVLMVQAAKLSALPHAALGVAVAVLGMQQPVNAWFRPHPPEARTRARIWWERWHKNAGRCAVCLGLANPFWGLAHLRAGPVLVALYGVWVATLATFWIVKSLQACRGCGWRVPGGPRRPREVGECEAVQRPGGKE